MNRPLWIALFLLLVLAVSDLFVVTVSALLFVFAGLLLGVFLGAISDWLAARSPLSRKWSYALVVLALFGSLAVGGAIMGNRIVQQVGELSAELRAAVDDGWRWLQTRRWIPDLDELDSVASQGSAILSRLTGAVGGVLALLTGLGVAFFVGLYVAYDPRLYVGGLLKLVPLGERPRAEEVVERWKAAMLRWIVARMVSMLVIGVLTAIGLSLLGVPLPITLGVLAALLTFVPNLGPIVAAIPQVLLALEVGASTAMWVIAFNLGLQTVESYLVTPMIERRGVTLPPAVTITAQLVFAVVFGVIGIMMAAPLVATAMVLAQILYVRDRLGDPEPGELATG